MSSLKHYCATGSERADPDRCMCDGCWACTGNAEDCTCDIDWDCVYGYCPNGDR